MVTIRPASRECRRGRFALAALYNPVWVSGIFTLMDFVLALAAFLLLVWGKLPSWLVVM